ncbi:MAG: methyl-accepting chemotaxis sensory transducer [Firmicutes bacterium]|nr:methyl-accepting chemotaxis sensory transducer [Bacillota bacterium]
MRRISIGSQLYAIFSVTTILLVILLGVTMYQFDSTSRAYQDMLTGPVQRTMTVKDAKDSFHSGIAELRGFLTDERHCSRSK